MFYLDVLDNLCFKEFRISELRTFLSTCDFVVLHSNLVKFWFAPAPKIVEFENCQFLYNLDLNYIVISQFLFKF